MLITFLLIFRLAESLYFAYYFRPWWLGIHPSQQESYQKLWLFLPRINVWLQQVIMMSFIRWWSDIYLQMSWELTRRLDAVTSNFPLHNITVLDKQLSLNLICRGDIGATGTTWLKIFQASCMLMWRPLQMKQWTSGTIFSLNFLD